MLAIVILSISSSYYQSQDFSYFKSKFIFLKNLVCFSFQCSSSLQLRQSVDPVCQPVNLHAIHQSPIRCLSLIFKPLLMRTSESYRKSIPFLLERALLSFNGSISMCFLYRSQMCNHVKALQMPKNCIMYLFHLFLPRLNSHRIPQHDLSAV